MASTSSASGETQRPTATAMETEFARPEQKPSSSAASAPSTSASPARRHHHHHHHHPRTTGQAMSDFALQLEDYTPTIPDPVVKYYMNSAGFATTDKRLTRLISIAAQKFVSDIANDALQHCKMRGAGQSKKAAKDKRYVLTMEDLTPALSEYGMNAKKPHYFS